MTLLSQSKVATSLCSYEEFIIYIVLTDKKIKVMSQTVMSSLGHISSQAGNGVATII